MINLAIFASGSGTNFQAIVDYFAEHPCIRASLLLCNKSQAAVLDKASIAGVDGFVFTRDELESTDKVSTVLREYNINFIVLAGFLIKIPDKILREFPDRIVNIHPALLPKYGGKGMYGKRVHEAVLASGDSMSGITIHMVNEKYDKGNIVSQHTCGVYKGDSPENLAERVHELEHYWYPRVIEKLLDIDS